MKFFLIPVSLLLAIQISFGQEKPKAKLVDEFGQLNCCFPYFDAFYNNLVETNSDGYVVISRDREYPSSSLSYLYAVRTIFLLRDFRAKIHFIRSKSRDQIRTQLWKVPPGAEIPEFGEEVWNFEVLPNTKPFVIWHESEIDQICNFFGSSNFISEIVSGNKEAGINVVIFANSQKTFLREKRRVLNTLIDTKIIKQSRLQFFKKPKKDFELLEIWLVPMKPKK